MNDRCCETCRYDLGGGYKNCRINLEAECAAGDYEAWEAKDSEAKQCRDLFFTDAKRRGDNV